MPDPRWAEVEKRIADCRSGGGYELDLSEVGLDHAEFAAAVFAEVVQQLPRIQRFDLRSSALRDAGLEALAKQAEHLLCLELLDLGGTRVKSVREEVLRTCDARLIFQAILQGRVVPEAKLLVLGEPDVGKSSLCQRVFQDKVPTEQTETHGFELIRPVWRPTIGGNIEVQLRVWDFGGQHILHGTHELFLTAQSVCLLVLDVTQVQERATDATPHTSHVNRLSYWLKLVRHFCGAETPVIIVVNKCDSLLPHELGQLDLDRLRVDCEISSQIQVVEGFSAIGTEEKYETAVGELRHAIKESLGQFEGLRLGRVPNEQFELKQRVESKIERRALISVAEYRKWCIEAGITDRRPQDVYLRTLDHFGSLSYFGVLPFEEEQLRRGGCDNLPPRQQRLLKAHRDSLLQDWLINPHWLTWPLYELVRTAAERKSPWFKCQDFVDAVTRGTRKTEIQPPDSGADVVRAVLELTELCLYVDEHLAWFFPRGLEQDAARFLTGWEDVHDVTWQWRFFPESFIHRFLVQAHQHHEVVNQTHWQTGAVVKYRNATAAVQSQPESGVVTVWLKKVPSHPEVPQLAELELVEHIRHRLVDLIGPAPDHVSESWTPKASHPSSQLQSQLRQLDDLDTKCKSHITAILKAHNLLTDELEQFVEILLAVTKEKLAKKAQTQLISFRAWYVCWNLLGRSPLAQQALTFASVFDDLGRSERGRVLWDCFGDQKHRPATAEAFRRAVSRALKSGLEQELNQSNPVNRSSPHSAGRRTHIDGEKRLDSDSA